jgi:hypothetical protein
VSRGRPLPLVVVFALLGLLIVGLPFVLMVLPNPEPIPIRSLSQGGTGTYVGGEPDLLKIFPRGILQDTVPKDAPHVGSSARVYVKARQMSDLAAYTLASAASGRIVRVKRTLLSPNTLEVTPENPLPAGPYVASVPRADAYGAIDYFYFVVDGSAAR